MFICDGSKTIYIVTLQITCEILNQILDVQNLRLVRPCRSRIRAALTDQESAACDGRSGPIGSTAVNRHFGENVKNIIFVKMMSLSLSMSKVNNCNAHGVVLTNVAKPTK